MRAYIGIDNGVTGSCACLHDGAVLFMAPIPTKKEQSYTKAKSVITRVDYEALYLQLTVWLHKVGRDDVRVFIERPMVNPGRFKATTSALRALEATLIVLENLDLSLEYVDSKQWQRTLLPAGCKGAPELKKASVDIGCRLFPMHHSVIQKHGDADALLIAEWARREGR